MSQGLKTALFRSRHWPLLALAFGSKPCSKAAKSERSGRRAGLAGILALVMSSAAPAASAHETMPDTFVDAATLAEGLVVDMRYYGASNFVGRPIAGYEAPVCLLTVEAAKALALAQERLRPLGLGLKLFDCYRPASAVADFVQWGPCALSRHGFTVVAGHPPFPAENAPSTTHTTLSDDPGTGHSSPATALWHSP